jgi:hypothetical protein
MKPAPYVGKLDAAKRQLESAILLYFNYCDPVSIHTLCAAAYNIVRDVNEKRRGELMLKDLWQFLDAEDAKVFKQHINRAENFFKHADKDPEASCTLDPEWTEAILLDASRKYIQLTGEQPPYLLVFMIWFVLRHPHVFGEVPEVVRVLEGIDSKAVPDDRKQFLTEFLSVAARFVGAK